MFVVLLGCTPVGAGVLTETLTAEVTSVIPVLSLVVDLVLVEARIYTENNMDDNVITSNNENSRLRHDHFHRLYNVCHT